jgi:YggT family protein
MIVVVVLLDLYALAVFLRLVMTWIVWPSTGLAAAFARAIYAGTEPPLAAIRTIVRPVRLGATVFDLSPVLLLVALWLLASLLFR